MKLSTKIAAARRRLRRIQEDYPSFLKRIEGYTAEQKALATNVFEKLLVAAKQELEELEGEQHSQPG